MKTPYKNKVKPIVSIKNVDLIKWRDFKTESARHGLPMGDFFGRLLEEHKRHEAKKVGWDAIIGSPAFLSNSEAEKIKVVTTQFRKAFSFR